MIKILDAIMGSGKSTYLINMVKSHPENKYLIVVPLLSEVKRYKENIENIHFVEPNNWGHTKKEHLLKLLSEGNNVITTHQLILRANKEVQEVLKREEYILIIDEALNVFSQIIVSRDDVELLKNNNLIYYDKNQKVIWNNNLTENEEYNHGVFELFKDVIVTGDVYYSYYNKNENCINVSFVWNFSPDFFEKFSDVFIATYQWNSNFQKYYFDLHQIEYVHLSLVKGELLPYSSEYEISDKAKFQKLITIIDDKKLNSIGEKVDRSYPLSKGWFSNPKNKELVKQLKNNIYNFFRHKTKTKSQDRMWTTYKSFMSKLSGEGYTGSDRNVCFVSLGSKCTNEYSHKKTLVYAANLFMEPYLKSFFIQNKLHIPEDEYALSEMIQWIWRSCIRDGKSIEIYIPSERMRTLFQKWLYE